MQEKLRFLVIDDSLPTLTTYKELLERAGHEVRALTSCDNALEEISTYHPDCIVCDLMLPGMDGLELFKRLRANSSMKQPAFVVISGKQFDYDKRFALNTGVDAYFTKPINPSTFVKDLISIIEGKMIIKFWGVRGTFPVTGKKSLKYGGNTNCVTLTIGSKHNFIFDAGTGIKELSDYIQRENIYPYEAKIFITHPHYDHINGIPYFVPLYVKGNRFEFLGTDQSSVTLEKCLSSQMDSVYFPVTMNEFGSTVSFRSLTEESIMIDDIRIETMLLNHPGRCLGFRVTYKHKVFCYVTDNELYLPSDKQRHNQEQYQRLLKFIENADVLIIDATYTDEEYAFKVGWGHSPLSSVIEIADKAHVKLLCLFHHDPDQSDLDIDVKLKNAQNLLRARHSTTQCIAPQEGDIIDMLNI